MINRTGVYGPAPNPYDTMQTLEYMRESVSSSSSAVRPNGSFTGQSESQIQKLDIDDFNLPFRREFMRLGDDQQKLLEDLIPWIKEHAADIAHDFYEWQFEFSRTADFFEGMSKAKNISMSQLRRHLEGAQTKYLIACFQGARQNWGLDYFESRLHIGAVHDRIDLPLKWYIGSYSEFMTLTRKKLLSSFEDRDYVDRVFDAVTRVFLLDIQAVADSFLLNTIERLGIDFKFITTDRNSDRTEHLALVKKQQEQINLRNADYAGQLAAISKSQAVIEFDLDGNILFANDNFLNAVGYTLQEVQGQHHRIFVDPEYGRSAEYMAFWQKLKSGQYHSGEFQRYSKTGASIWIQASYNPICDPNGVPFKVVKYASDITKEVEAKIHLEKSVETILHVVDQASHGDLTVDIDIVGDDAIGQMATGLKHFLDNLKETIAKIDDSAQMLSAASEELSAVSNKMGSNANETSSEANHVALSAEEVSSNIQTVAAGAEEMTASIKSVASSADEASKVANEAVAAAEQTNLTVTKLGESSMEIGKVIKVITSIAQQTNLLALNATIEAARAGEAGKGFAVVANEVKELAKQTAQATEEISQKIEAIQSDTTGAVQAISHISDIIGQINEFQGSIATAVEEQSSTTSEIARNVHEAAKGSTEIAENISKVAMAAESTSSGATDTQRATTELAQMASTLQSIVAQFKY